MPSCDLCHEYTSEPSHCEWCGLERPAPAPDADDGYELTRVDVNHALTCDAGNWSAINGA